MHLRSWMGWLGWGVCAACSGAPDAADGSAGGAGQPGAAPGDCPESAARFVTGVVDYEFGTGQDFGQADFPEPILGPPRGSGTAMGSLDVVSLGNGGWVIVEFENNAIVDGEGPDFIVFENPFYFGGDENNVFAELGTVSVSDDLDAWHEFPCTASEPPYESCAGAAPVHANADDNDIDALDPEQAGGDAFDLAELGVAQARFVRIVDRVDLAGSNGVFDLDAVGVVHALCP
jgi:hypothetical protein